MKHIKTKSHRKKFEVIAETKLAEAAMMTLKPGATSDQEVANEHPRSEQWMYVISGTGTATVAQGARLRTHKLRAGSLLVIARGERHQIRNTGRDPLQTLNTYVPSAYTLDGKLKPSAKR